jgi:hypothetical protein
MHLTRTELERWRDHAPAEDRERVTTHLASCETCAARYAELFRTRPAIDRRPRAGGRSWWLRLLPIGMVAIVLAVVGPSMFWQAPTPPFVRGSDFTYLAPSGTLDAAPAELRWQTPVSASIFVVEVFDGGGGLVWRRETASVATVDARELADRLQPRREYRWMVTALDARGQPIVSSPLTPFQIVPRR